MDAVSAQQGWNDERNDHATPPDMHGSPCIQMPIVASIAMNGPRNLVQSSHLLRLSWFMDRKALQLCWSLQREGQAVLLAQPPKQLKQTSK